MQLLLKNAAGTTVRAVIVVQPVSGTSITQRADGSASLVKPSGHLERIGEVPCKVIYKFHFFKRPWSLEFEAQAGKDVAPFMVSSEKLGLKGGVLLDPDVLELVVKAEEGEPEVEGDDKNEAEEDDV